jgi:hypothetical protein
VAERTLDGTCTVTAECGLNAVAGVNTIVLPFAAHVPGTAGLMRGIGEPAASGAENAIVTGAAPFTWRAACPGVTDSTRNGPVCFATGRA